jgi:hypothetical protein
MAATDAGRRLTEAHRLAQIRVQAETVLQLSRAWPALDPTNLSRTWPPVERFATALVADRRARSANLAASYLDGFVQAEAGGRLANAPALMSAINVEQVRTSLQVTGPVAIKNATARGVPVAKAAQDALATVGASAGRHVANGGRETLLATALNEGFDRWSRISDGRPCPFCAMLVSRGPVYLSAGSGGFQAHDHCGCTAEIVVSGDGWTEQARQFRDEWDDATRGETDALAAFRRGYGDDQARRSAITASARTAPQTPSLASTLQNAKMLSEERVGVDSVNDVFLRRYSDGTGVIVKDVDPIEVRTEVLSARVANALDIDIDVQALGDDRIAMRYIDNATHGKTGSLREIADMNPIPGVTDSDDGLRIGILDTITGQQDRHGQNWLRLDDGRLVPIDNGESFRSLRMNLAPDSPFANDPALGVRPIDKDALDRFDKPYTRNVLDRSDMDEIYRRVEALEPEFSELGQRDWWEKALARTGQLRDNATGTRRVLG